MGEVLNEVIRRGGEERKGKERGEKKKMTGGIYLHGNFSIITHTRYFVLTLI